MVLDETNSPNNVINSLMTIGHCGIIAQIVAFNSQLSVAQRLVISSSVKPATWHGAVAAPNRWRHAFIIRSLSSPGMCSHIPIDVYHGPADFYRKGFTDRPSSIWWRCILKQYPAIPIFGNPVKTWQEFEFLPNCLFTKIMLPPASDSTREYATNA